MSKYGRNQSTDPDFGVVAAGTIRACTYDILSQDAWVWRFGGHLGRNTGTNVSVRFALFIPVSGDPEERIAYSNSASANTSMTDGTGGAVITATLASVDPVYGTTKGARASSNKRYSIGVLPSGASVGHGMIQASAISETYENFYEQSGLGSTPPDPMNAGSPSIEGWMTLFVDYDVNVKPEVPTSLSPTGSISTLTPTFLANFRDLNGAYGTSSGLGDDRGDEMKQYAIQLRLVGTTSNLWDQSYNASNTEQNNNQFSRVYGGSALTNGLSYEWRCRMSDQFGAYSDWTAWTSFTTSSGGVVTGNGTPTGKQSNPAAIVFQAKWTHQASLSMTHAKIRLLQNGIVIATSASFVKAAASSAAPGTLFSISSADTSSPYNAMVSGGSYAYQVQGQDSAGIWSDWSPSRSFTVNSQPNTPTNLSPSNSKSTTSLPKLTCNMTDPDDSVATGLTCKCAIYSDPIFINASCVSNISGWSASAAPAGMTATFAYDSSTTGDIDGGSAKYNISASTAASGVTVDLMNDTFIPVENTYPFDATIYARVSNTNLRPRIIVKFYDVSQVAIGSPQLEATWTPTANVWSNRVLTVVPPVNAKYAKVGVQFSTNGANITGSVNVDFPDSEVSVRRLRSMSLRSGTSSTWDYQTVSDDMPDYNTYYWEAFGYDGAINGTVSPQATYIYAVGPVVTITSPTEAQVLTTSTPTITWTVTGQQKYRVQVYQVDAIAGNILVYDSGVVIDTTPSHVMPSGNLFNGYSYQLYVTSTNGSNIDGTSAVRNFSVVYAAVSPVTNVFASGKRYKFDKVASAVIVSWDETVYPPDTFEYYSIYRYEDENLETTLQKIGRNHSPGHLTFVDFHPVSGVNYIYGISQTIHIGSELVESVITQTPCRVDLIHTVIQSVDEGDDFRIVCKYWTDRGFDTETDSEEITPWGASKPTVFFGSVYFRRFNMTAQFQSDEQGTLTNYINAINDILTRRGLVSMRDPKGRRVFGVLRKAGEQDKNLGFMIEVDLEITETNFTESVS